MGWWSSSGSKGRIGADQDIAAELAVYEEAIYPTYNLGSN